MNDIEKSFDKNLPPALLIERCVSVSVTFSEQGDKALMTFTFCEGPPRRHTVYPQNPDWSLCERLSAQRAA